MEILINLIIERKIIMNNAQLTNNIETVKTIANLTLKLVQKLQTEPTLKITKINLPINTFISNVLNDISAGTLVEIFGKFDTNSKPEKIAQITILGKLWNNNNATVSITDNSDAFETAGIEPMNIDFTLKLDFTELKTIVPEIRELLRPAINNLFMNNKDDKINRIGIATDETGFQFELHDELVETIQKKLFEVFNLLDVNHDINTDELDQDLVKDLIARLERPAEPHLDPNNF